MADMKQVYDFAVKWCDKFRDEKVNYIELVDHYLADDCDALGFEMDCGNSFAEVYGDAEHNYEELNRIIDTVTDIKLLGSAIYSRWRYFNHWAYNGEEILEFKNRSWFILALSRLSLLSGENPFIFKGVPQKIRIVSNSIGFGPCPEPKDIVEQRITINSSGRVWFSAYAFGDGFGKYEKAQTRNYKIEKAVAEDILQEIATYFSDEYDEIFATDIGNWEMQITNTEGKVYKFNGSLCAIFEVDGFYLSDLIRDALEIDDLYVFDGSFKPDKVNRITVDYHRVTKIKPKLPIREEASYLTWDYTEQLIIDRRSESIEHIQNIGTDCIISHKYQVPDGVVGLLDDLDAEYLFEYIEGNPSDVIDTPDETKEYTITIDFNKNPQRVIKGTYDKKGLPEDFEEFAETVFRFMSFYGFGEILDPSTYGKVRRQKNDYIFCSITFDKGQKSYYYITDDDSIEVGDFVLVPAGGDNHIAMVAVVNIEYFSQENVPMPVDKTKRIIRKCTEEDLDLPEEQHHIKNKIYS
ncbi:hypothetical protein [Acetobacterium sp.]|uniref:hypothetical protein n=1 Tax=Acetobacterium sp. TaxID=1872094 RepID=UPI0035948027